MSSTGPIKLRIPRQDLQDFKLFRLDADAASQWTQALPVANTKSVASQLRNALGDLNRVQLGPESRFDILEVLRPNLQVALANLSRRYLNQPLVLPVEPRQLAELADNLCSAACTAYTVVATEAIRQQDAIRNMNPARLVCASIQAALEFASQRLLLTFQLYRTVELHGWLEMHQLYALAESQNLDNLPVSDGRSVSATYLQGLMLGCCKPNQLRQSDQAAIFRGLRDWAKLVQILPPESETGMFIVDLDSDQPPLYSSLYDNRSSSCRYVSTAPLVEHLEQLRAEDERQGMRGIAFDKDTIVPSNILDHLIMSLGETSVRNFSRSSEGKSLCIGIGLSSTHYLLAGEKSFEQVLYGNDYVPPAARRVETNPFLQDLDKRDLWQQANPEEDYAGDDEEANASEGARDYRHRVEVDERTRAVLEDDDDAFLPPRKSYPVYRVNTIDASPGGYCVAWPEELPGDIRTGDIVSVREDQDKDWALAVIRWISSLEDAGTMIGLELLSPRAKPYGAVIHQKKGVTSEPIRVLLLPEISLVGQPHTLITPRAGFRERQKITLLREGEAFYIQLLRQVAGTGSFTQFDFRYIKQLGEVIAEDKSGPFDSPFDSVWSKL